MLNSSKDEPSNKKTAIAKEITESIAKHAGAPKSAINVIFTDFPEGTLFQSGEMREKK